MFARRWPARSSRQGNRSSRSINPDDLWVRIDVEETYIDRVRVGDTLTVRLPSGDERQGTVFYRGVDAGYATQRDVSRTKRDIKTFELRLRVDNADRRLAVGMTAYVVLPALIDSTAEFEDSGSGTRTQTTRACPTLSRSATS